MHTGGIKLFLSWDSLLSQECLAWEISEALLAVPIFKDRNRGSSMELSGSEGLEGGLGCGRYAASLPTGKTLEENYETDAQLCWHDYKDYMDSIKKDWCDWALISR